MSYQRVVLFDMEMCCWGNKTPNGDIIQIGLVEYNLVSEEITRTSNYYITPIQDNISEYCTSLTGITSTFILKNGKALSAVLQSIKDKYGSSNTMYCCWGDDANYLNNICLKYKLINPIKHSLNLSLLFLLKNRVKSSNKIGLMKALHMLGHQFDGMPHDALTDSKNLIPIVKYLL